MAIFTESVALVSTREPLDQPVKIFTALAERLHRDALVLAVGAHVARKPADPNQTSGERHGAARSRDYWRAGVSVSAFRSVMAKPRPQSRTRPDEMAHG
jgi:hypothetical protein